MEIVRVIPDQKRCRICNQEKPADEFRPDPRMRDGLYSYCKPCAAAKSRQWDRENPEKRAAIMTLTEYGDLLTKQDGRCAICSTTDPGRGPTFAVDHDHADGRVRGLLCHSCNLALGQFGDNIDRLRAAITYLGG